LDAPLTWKIGPASYGASSTPRASQINAFVRIIAAAKTETPDASNGAYAASRLFVHMTPSGSGDYTLVDSTSKVTDESGAKVAFIIAVAESEAEDSSAETTWHSSTGLISVKVDSENRYHASTIEPLTLTRHEDSGTGVPDSPDQISFEMQNIFGNEDPG